MAESEAIEVEDEEPNAEDARECLHCGEVSEELDCDGLCPRCFEHYQRYKALKDERRREKARRRRAAEAQSPKINVRQLMRVAQLRKPKHLEHEWNALMENATARAAKLLDEMPRPPTELWALREQFLKSVISAAMLESMEGEIPEIDEAEIEAMFAPKRIDFGDMEGM
jgi:hypothetical protein